MRIIHSFKNFKIEKKAEANLGFLLTNPLGDFLWFGTVGPASRFQGWFVSSEAKPYRIIENIALVDANGGEISDFSEIENNLFGVSRKSAAGRETFFLPRNCHSLVYETDSKNKVRLTLDVKEIYESKELGRNYEIGLEKGVLIVKFNQDNEPAVYVAIKSDGACPNDQTICSVGRGVEEKKEWILRKYDYDKERNSPPFERWVYRAIDLNASKIVFAAAFEKEAAVNEVKEVFENSAQYKAEARRAGLKPPKSEQETAYFLAQNSLTGLVAIRDGLGGVRAGLPWFFQFWCRDEAISLNVLVGLNKNLAKEILLSRLEEIRQDGRLPSFRGSSMIGADAAGWFFKRAADFIDLKIVNKEEIKKVAFHLEKTIDGLLKFHTQDDFDINGPRETWMDSDYENDTRQGARIEIQALRLNMYKSARQLTGKEKYRQLEKSLAGKVREKFFKPRFLADGLDDWTARPNIFIAYYVYPELLKAKEWEECFDGVLEKLWLDWGGLATIDKNHPLFCSAHTGEFPKSYHRGDSWFWLNNLAAIALYRVNSKKYRSYIEKMLAASENIILRRGALGHLAELSSAQESRAQGCPAMAWSGAMYIEAVEEIK